MKILFCDTSFEHARDALARHLPDDEILYCPEAAIADHIGQADVAIPLMATLDAERIARGEQLRLIHQFGVGLEGVDVAAATRRGIAVGRVPSQETGNAVAVAEWTVFLMLALARHLPVQGESIAARRLGTPLGVTLFGRRAGLVGLGNLGRAIAPRLKALGMEVSAVTRTPAGMDAPSLGVDFLGALSDLDRVLETADFLIVTLPLEDETRGLIGQAELERMKPSAYLINVSRGPVVDYTSLTWALRTGRIAGAGLDVFWREPVDPADPLLQLNVIVSPHIAGVTDHSYDLMARAVAKNVENLRRGLPLQNVV